VTNLLITNHDSSITPHGVKTYEGASMDEILNLNLKRCLFLTFSVFLSRATESTLVKLAMLLLRPPSRELLKNVHAASKAASIAALPEEALMYRILLCVCLPTLWLH
jgi:hypothetical protein